MKKRVYHGLSKAPEYQIWRGMIQRCEDQNASNYYNYGARGVRVCKQWRADFGLFLKDVGPRPSKDHSLDRHPDREGNYEPGNVRWATRVEQNRNARSNVTVRALGKSKILSEWEEESGITADMISYRIKSGWSPEDAVTVPLGKRRKSNVMLTVHGEEACASVWARRSGLTLSGVLDRVKRGLPIEQVLDPKVKNKVLITIAGKTKRLTAWAAESPVTSKTISLRLNAGWSPYKAVFTPALKPGKERSSGRAYYSDAVQV